jgi:short-subunit dehydrogenase
MEYHGTNLTVSLVHPGAIATPIKANSPFATTEDKKSAEKEFESQKGDKRLTSAPEAARQIVEGMLNGQTRILIGKDAKIQDLLARFLPKAHTKLFHGFLKEQLK